MLDLGCGSGTSLEYFKARKPNVRWVGLDVESPRWVDSPSSMVGSFLIYDGATMPFGDGRFDLVYCNQVFEHVRRPLPVLQEVARVLRTDGYLIGSTSQLEPYHARSVWNYTPYGFALLIEEAGLDLLEIRPSIDAVTLIVRRALGRPALFARWWQNESPVNWIISCVGRIARKDATWSNYVKLLFCGQFCFLARKCAPGGV